MSILKKYNAASGLWQAVGGMGLPQTPISFTATKTVTQSITQNVVTKVTFDTVSLNKGSCFDASTSIFKPTIAGLYLVGLSVRLVTSSDVRTLAYIYKNGVEHLTTYKQDPNVPIVNISGLVYMNGTTDYVEPYVKHENTSAQSLAGNSYANYFQACLIPDSYDSTKQIVNLSAATSDYLLGVGETAKILYSEATSVPLHIATKEGEYEVKINPSPRLTSCTDAAGYLQVNNTTYTNGISRQYTNGAGSTVSVGLITTDSAFLANAHILINSHLHISTKTGNKQVLCHLGYINSAGTHNNQTYSAYMTDTVTPWTSLGTITFANAQSGTIIIKRVA